MTLEGRIAAQGKVNAKVFVCNDPRDKSPYKDYRLGTQNADPLMAPLLYSARGIITEVGGLMSHLAVVSRELGIPCITGCKDCYLSLKTGEEIEIDATDRLNSRVVIRNDCES